MKSTLVLRTALAWLATGLTAVAAHASTQVITFDDVTADTGTDSITPIPVGYAGIDQWSNWDVISDDACPGTGYATGVVSGSYAAFNSYGQPAIFSAAVPFDLDFVDLTASGDGADTVEISGYLDGNPVYATAVTITDVLPTLATLDFDNVDTVEFANADTGESFVADNLTLSSVPEPASVLLLGSAGLLSLRRRR